MDGNKKTALYDVHKQIGAKMIDFFGWALPLHYGSQLKEHEIVRSDVGVFDVSHMLITEIIGKDAKFFIQEIITNDINKLNIKGKALYSPILNNIGGILDDLIVYRINESESIYIIVSNGSTREKNLKHFNLVAEKYDVKINPRYDLSMLAVQGPKSIEKVLRIKPNWQKINDLSTFQGSYMEKDCFISKTGYTGEIGIEIILSSNSVKYFFEQLVNNGITPCGLGARDTLRIEAGMNLYGQDIDENTSPLESGLSWTVSFSKDYFIGKESLLKQKNQGLKFKQIGLIIEEKVILRNGMKVISSNLEQEGIITSGTFSPTLKKSIAIAKVPIFVEDNVKVNVRGNLVQAKLVKLPFVRNGKKLFDYVS